MKFQHRNSLQRRCLNAQPAKNDLMLLPEQKFWRLKAFFSLTTVNQKQQKNEFFSKKLKIFAKKSFFVVGDRQRQPTLKNLTESKLSATNLKNGSQAQI